MADHDESGAPNEAAIARLATLPEMEFRTAMVRMIFNLRRQTDEQTEIIADTQEVLNRDVLGKVKELYDIVETARGFFSFLGKVGAAGMWCIETAGKIARPLVWIAAFVAATWAWWKSGSFVFPNWFK